MALRKKIVKYKTCRNEECGKVLPLAGFNKCATSKDGRQGLCRECDRAASRKWYHDPENHPEAKEKRAKWQKDHPEDHLRHCRDYQGRQKKKREDAESGK